MWGIIILLVTAYCIGVWIHALVTYDWTKFEEDSKDDDFLKPYE
jgi:hypothetical protein